MDLRDKKVITITIAFHKKLNQCNGKPSKIWLEKSTEFNSKSKKSWLEDIIQKSFEHITKEILLLLKDLLEAKRTKFTNI